MSKPRLGFVGPLLGKHPNWVTSQGEILAALFAGAGYSVKQTSTVPNRLLRLADTIAHLLSWWKQVDVVVLMVFSGPAFGMADISSWLARALGIPLVLWLHGGNLPQFSRQHPAWVRRVLARGMRIVSPSAYLANFFARWDYQVDVIPNVLALEDYAYCHRQQVQPRLLWMRTFEDLYYPEMAVEVLAQLQSSYPEATLTMAGQAKGTLARAQALTSARGLAGKVRFAGFLDKAGKQREFARHDIFLNTNRVDNMPVSVVEAAAFGLPVVATAVGGIPYLLEHEKTGLLVDNEDVAGMTTAVIRLLENPSLAARLSDQGRQLAESCAWEIVQSKWEQIFRRLHLTFAR
jgi:glycosyltransferase involved in cell wall biosynthesis